MGKERVTAPTRRVLKVVAIFLFSFVVFTAHTIDSISLTNNSRLTGWVLLLCLIFLSLFSLRKTISFIPIGSASTWRSLHIWIGILSILLFLCHVDFRSPHGGFERVLAFIYLVIVFVGVLGVVVSKVIPRRLAVHGKEVLFERIPHERAEVRTRFESLIRKAVKEGKTELFSERFLNKLYKFFSAPRGLFLHLLDSRRPQYSIQTDISSLSRQVGVKERDYLEQLSNLVTEKDHLDYCYVHQLILKYWSMLHAPLGGAILLLTLLHILLVYSFMEV